MLSDLQTKLQEEYARQKANPTGTPKLHRSAGGAMLVLGITVTIINVLSLLIVGRIFIMLLAANLVFLGAGVYMLVTGKNPFAKMKR